LACIVSVMALPASEHEGNDDICVHVVGIHNVHRLGQCFKK
jgi:hypothetical protein